MSLLEIMVVITLIGLVTAAIAVNVFGADVEARISHARTEAHSLASAVDMWRLRHGRVPTTNEGLVALMDPPPLLRGGLPVDPWGHAYNYVSPGEKNPYSVDIVSAGPDGIINTHDDVGNWTQ